MLFQINTHSDKLEAAPSNWSPRELELEDYLVHSVDGGARVLDQDVFGEPLLLVSNQVKTRLKKRADILALDRRGNGVIVELKRDEGRLGVETQALQYLADFSAYRGRGFLDRFAEPGGDETVLGFLDSETDVEDINQHARVILMARVFDETVFSIGEWLSSKGVAFRCLTYTPIEISGKRFLSFSVAFDRSPRSLYGVRFAPAAREPGVFWHNIGRFEEDWWRYLVNTGQITASFTNSPGDQGEVILTGYQKDDRIIAYANGYGALGWGIIQDPTTYRLIRPDSEGDREDGGHRHRLDITWKATAPRLSDGIPPAEVRERFGIYHPVPTSQSIKPDKARGLIEELGERFG